MLPNGVAPSVGELSRGTVRIKPRSEFRLLRTCRCSNELHTEDVSVSSTDMWDPVLPKYTDPPNNLPIAHLFKCGHSAIRFPTNLEQTIEWDQDLFSTLESAFLGWQYHSHCLPMRKLHSERMCIPEVVILGRRQNPNNLRDPAHRQPQARLVHPTSLRPRNTNRLMGPVHWYLPMKWKKR